MSHKSKNNKAITVLTALSKNLLKSFFYERKKLNNRLVGIIFLAVSTAFNSQITTVKLKYYVLLLTL